MVAGVAEGFGLFAAALTGLEALAAEAAVPDVAEDLVDRAAALARVMRLGGEAGAAIANFWRWWWLLLLLLQYGMVWVTTIVGGQKQWQKSCWSLDWIGRGKSGMMARGSGRRVLLTNSSLEFVGPGIAA